MFETVSILSGRQTLTYSSIKNEFTYTRIYEGNEFYDPVRKTLSKSSSQMKQIGSSPASYAISQYAEEIEYISGLSLDVLQRQTNAYSIQYMIYHYFDTVVEPQEGDLVFYSNPEDKLKMSPLVGIFKGETVLIKYNVANSVFSEGYIFFNADFYGNIATFYRLKTQPVPFDLQYPPLLKTQPIRYTIPEGILGDLFVCDPSIDMRYRIRFCKTPEHLMWHFEEVQLLDCIQFEGRCHDYAFGKFLGTYSTPNYMRTLSKREILIKYFDTTIRPEKGDLAIYYCDLHDDPDHYGIYLENNRIESKWGKMNVNRHRYFDTPHIYGPYLKFVKLKPGLSKEWFYYNIKLDHEGRDPDEPIILNQDEDGYKTLLLFSYRKPKEPGVHRGATHRLKPFKA